jgi:hypothetical protein
VSEANAGERYRQRARAGGIPRSPVRTVTGYSVPGEGRSTLISVVPSPRCSAVVGGDALRLDPRHLPPTPERIVTSFADAERRHPGRTSVARAFLGEPHAFPRSSGLSHCGSAASRWVSRASRAAYSILRSFWPLPRSLICH